ncbi:uncharacterized protein LOC136093883 [Hydra vulgaris]|uniref:uncharacterized protein LOC136093883 n=1 Tax=Hydra vulgaris TaxID=6087 RepID=UPI0032E9FA4D
MSASLLKISPQKKISKHDKLEYGKQKVKKLETSMTNLVASALDIDPKEIISEKKQKCINCNDLDKLLDVIKEKVKISLNEEKIQLLTLTPDICLKELYLEFKKFYPEHKVGFSKFCELRPKWCLTIDSGGSHSVCVCSYHQNAKLMCSALSNSNLIYYKDLMKVCVCNIDSQNCMFNLCFNCSGKINLKTDLENVFEKNDFDFDYQITYKQWVSTDRTSLITVQTSISEFIETLSETLYDLCHHHFIKEAQSSYLSEAKQTLDQYTCIILMDFAENYSFLVQDAIQGFYWQADQATLHPFVIYYKDEKDHLKCECYCLISDHLCHDQSAVHCFLKKLLPMVKIKLHTVNKVKHFSDGAASQYKNYKCLINLIYHIVDHQINAEHHFFATSHGKSPCDGIGGTIKREAAKASLRAAITNQILTPQDLFTWAQKNIKGVNIFYPLSDDINNHETTFNLQKQYEGMRTVSGTRSYQCFVPDGEKLFLRRISSDTVYDTHVLNDVNLILKNPSNF